MMSISRSLFTGVMLVILPAIGIGSLGLGSLQAAEIIIDPNEVALFTRGTIVCGPIGTGTPLPFSFSADRVEVWIKTSKSGGSVSWDLIDTTGEIRDAQAQPLLPLGRYYLSETASAAGEGKDCGGEGGWCQGFVDFSVSPDNFSDGSVLFGTVRGHSDGEPIGIQLEMIERDRCVEPGGFCTTRIVGVFDCIGGGIVEFEIPFSVEPD